MGVLEIAERLRTLASDPEHRHAIVHDQHMLPTLTVFLENSAETPAVRRATLDTLEYLAMHAPNRLAMRSEPGLSAALLSVAEKTDSGVSARLARSILAAIAEPSPAAMAAMAADPFETPCKERVEVPHALLNANNNKLRDATISDYTFFVKASLHRLQKYFFFLNFFFFSSHNGLFFFFFFFFFKKRACMVKRNATPLSNLCSQWLVLCRFGSTFINKRPRFALASIRPLLSKQCERASILILNF
jgi:hypothetical protein